MGSEDIEDLVQVWPSLFPLPYTDSGPCVIPMQGTWRLLQACVVTLLQKLVGNREETRGAQRLGVLSELLLMCVTLGGV